MAAGRMPHAAGVCPLNICGHPEWEASRAFVGTPCALCGEPIGFGREFFQQCGWRLLAHRSCVLGDLDGWATLATRARGIPEVWA